MSTASSASNNAVLARFMALPQGKSIQAEYIWIGGSGQDIRSKTKTITSGPVKDVSQLPVWNFDGSSTGQAPGDDSEVYLKPVRICPDPFRLGDNILVLCECVTPTDQTPIKTNSRAAAKAIFDKASEHEPWFGIEQEYTLFQKDGKTPLGWPKEGYPAPQGPYYCGNGTLEAAGRHIVEAHYRACLFAGLTVSGTNAEVMAGQWEYQVGPVCGIDSGDQIWLSRYLLVRVAEEFGAVVSFDPKPIAGDWNGAGAHCNYSTKAMRSKGGYEVILKAIDKLAAAHQAHIAAYGEGNERRLTGAHETASIEEFSFGVANRGASVRIPRTTHADQYGYLEDRRPASNCDPYVVTSLITQTTCL